MSLASPSLAPLPKQVFPEEKNWPVVLSPEEGRASLAVSWRASAQLHLSTVFCHSVWGSQRGLQQKLTSRAPGTCWWARYIAGCGTQDIGPRQAKQDQETTGSWLSITYNLFLGNQEFLSSEDQRWEVLNSTWPFPMCPEPSGLPSKREPYFSILSYGEGVMSEANREAQQWGTALPWKY